MNEKEKETNSGKIHQKLWSIPTMPKDGDFIVESNQILRRELFKKFYYSHHQFRLNETDDAVECYETILNEYHKEFSTLLKDSSDPKKREQVRVLPEWKKDFSTVERC